MNKNIYIYLYINLSIILMNVYSINSLNVYIVISDVNLIYKDI